MKEVKFTNPYFILQGKDTRPWFTSKENTSPDPQYKPGVGSPYLDFDKSKDTDVAQVMVNTLIKLAKY